MPLAGTDTAAFTQTFDTRNVGTTKTLTPAGAVTDGNSGANYAITFVNDTTGEITARAITVTAMTDTKAYDATTSSRPTPTITTGRSGRRHVRTSPRPSNRTSGTQDAHPGRHRDRRQQRGQLHGHLRQRRHGHDHRPRDHRPAATNTKTYDGTTSAAARRRSRPDACRRRHGQVHPDLRHQERRTGNKVLVPAGIVNDGNGGANYTVTFVNATRARSALEP